MLQPITYFPFVWAINGTPNVYYFEALTEVKVGRAPRETVVELMSELVERYAETLSHVEHLVFSDAYRRVISVLLYIGNHFGERRG